MEQWIMKLRMIRSITTNNWGGFSFTTIRTRNY